MEIKHIKELMAVMGRTGTKRLMIKKEGFELQLERQENGKMCDLQPEISDEAFLKHENGLHRSSFSVQKSKEIPPSKTLLSSSNEEEGGVFVTSPMVGTFYSTASPDDPPFIKIGDRIEKDSVVCIIEAMKVMNEVKAGVLGTVVEVLVENGHPVEFGTKLFRIS